MGALGAICLGCLLAASKAVSEKRNHIARLRAMPAILIVGLFGAGVIWGEYAVEGYPDKIFAEIFDVPPPATVTNLRAYSDDDELDPVFLQFQAPPATIKTLLGATFRPAPNAIGFGPMAEAQAFHLKPAWFDTTLAPSAQVYQLSRDEPSSGYIAIYDPKLNRVRVYLDNPVPLHFR